MTRSPAAGAAGVRTPGARTPGILVACALGLACWIVYLGFSLNQDQYVVRRWGVAWIGLDIAEVVGLLVTARLLRRRSPLTAPAAAAAGTLFLTDAWFDTVTSTSGIGYALALGLAGLGELPLGIYCIVLAVRAARSLG